MMETLETAGEERSAASYQPSIAEWLAAWPAVRRDAVALLDAFRQVRPGYDPHWVEWVLSEMDDAVMNLEHRSLWLRQHLDDPPGEA